MDVASAKLIAAGLAADGGETGANGGKTGGNELGGCYVHDIYPCLEKELKR